MPIAVHDIAPHTAMDEAVMFLDYLLSARAGDIDLIAAQTMYWANIYRDRGLDLYRMRPGDWSLTTFGADLIERIHFPGRPTSSSGLQVWQHTACASQQPALPLPVREIWNKLTTATEDTVTMAEAMHLSTNTTPWQLDQKRVPNWPPG